jgi:hypothetical protein
VKHFIVAVVSVGALIALPGFARAITPEPVIATPLVELQPAAAEGYLGYSQNSSRHPNRFNLYVRPDAQPRFRVNPRRTIAFAGMIDGTTLAYYQRRLSDKRYDIKLFDIVSKTRPAPPAGLNTSRSEITPAISSDWLLFKRLRHSGSPGAILLASRTSSEVRTLEPRSDSYVQVGGLAGNYAVWTRCGRLSHCQTWRYDIAAQTKTRLANPAGRSQFAASVLADGTTYYAESGTILCRRDKTVRFFRQPLVGSRELLAKLGRGKDTALTSPVILMGGGVDLFFDRFTNNCARSDIYKLSIGP